VVAIAWQPGARSGLRIPKDARVTFIAWSERVAQHRGALVAQTVFSVVVCGVPLAALEQHDGEARSRQFLGNNPSGRAGTHHYRFHSLMNRRPFSRRTARVREAVVPLCQPCASSRRFDCRPDAARHSSPRVRG